MRYPLVSVVSRLRRRVVVTPSVIFAVLALSAGSGPAHAGPLTVSFTALSNGTPVDLTGVGTAGWAYFSADELPTETKKNSAQYANPLGYSGARFADAAAPLNFSWTDGALVPAAAGQHGGVANSGSGTLGLRIYTFKQVATVVRLYVYAKDARLALYSSLDDDNGSLRQSYDDTALDAQVGAKAGFYTFTFTPNGTQNSVSANFLQDVSHATGSTFGIQAVTISTAPEPGIVGLLLAATGATALGRSGGRGRSGDVRA